MLFEVSIQIASYFSLVATEYSFQTPIGHQDILTHLRTTSFDSPPPTTHVVSTGMEQFDLLKYCTPFFNLTWMNEESGFAGRNHCAFTRKIKH